MVTYGVAQDADLRAEKIVIDGLSTTFEVTTKGDRLGAVTVPSPGIHVALNSLAAIAVAMEVGISFERAASALARFGGISRRFEIKGEAAGRIVLDDYAHHPAEVRATLAAVRASFKRRVVAVFQPHRYTRLRDLFDEFLSAFDDADVLYLFEVYPAGEEPIADVSSRRLYEALRARGHLEVHYLGADDNPAARIALGSRQGDVVATLGAGDIYRVGGEILDALAAEVKVHEGA
jgi:UDP-N-acetylmuramate--alanine ligase